MENIFRSSRPLLLKFPHPWGPITPFLVWKSVSTLALKSPRIINFSDFGTAVTRVSSSS